VNSPHIALMAQLSREVTGLVPHVTVNACRIGSVSGLASHRIAVTVNAFGIASIVVNYTSTAAP